MNKLYSTHCPQCKALELKLKKANIEYEICDDMNEMKAKGFAAAPMLETEDGIMNFAQAIKWINNK